MVRNSMIPSLLEKAKLNADRYQDFGLFEVSRVAKPQTVDGIPDQPYFLTIVRVGQDSDSTYAQLKFALDKLNTKLFSAAISITQSEKGSPAFHPGMSGQLYMGDQAIGNIGVVHPQVVKNLQLSLNISALEIDLSSLMSLLKHMTGQHYQNINNFPIVTRDVSFWQQPSNLNKPSYNHRKH